MLKKLTSLSVDHIQGRYMLVFGREFMYANLKQQCHMPAIAPLSGEVGLTAVLTRGLQCLCK